MKYSFITVFLIVLSNVNIALALPIPSDDLNFIGQGNMEGNIVFVEFPKTLVESWLPSGIKLADQNWTTDKNSYPVAIMTMQQSEVVFGYTNKASVHNHYLGTYLETILWAPFVKVDPKVLAELNPHKVYSHMLRLFLNSEPGLRFGIDYYGINKFPGVMQLIAQSDENDALKTYTIDSPSGLDVLTANYAKVPLATPSLNNFDFLLKMKSSLSQPYLFKHPKTGEMVCAEVKWNFPRSNVSASNVRVEMYDRFAPGLSGATVSTDANGYGTYPTIASFSIDIPWKFTGPQTCK